MNSPRKIGIIGSSGRMGTSIREAVSDATDLELTATVGHHDPLDDLNGVDVVIDVTTPEAVLGNVKWAVDHGIHVVVGTSGLGTQEREQIATMLGDNPTVAVHIVPNFSIAAVLSTLFATRAAAYFDDVEITEYAGPHKLDAPSGTAEETARKIAQARSEATGASLPGPCGHLVHDVPVHSLRMKGLLSRQRVEFAAQGEGLRVEFETTDRAAFMPGVLLALRHVGEQPGLTVGLDALVATVAES